MIFWAGILFSGFFVWFVLKIGFYQTWTMLFNIVVSIYLAIYLGPIIANIVPSAGDTSYSSIFSMIVTAIASFLVLHGIAYVFFTSQFNVSFPRILDVLGSGLLGFSAGFLVWSFIILLICITPFSRSTLAKEIGLDLQYQQTSAPYISWWCNLLGRVVASKDNTYTAEQALNDLVKNVRQEQAGKTIKKPAPAEPNKPAESNSPQKDNTTQIPPDSNISNP